MRTATIKITVEVTMSDTSLIGHASLLITSDMHTAQNVIPDATLPIMVRDAVDRLKRARIEELNAKR